MLQRISKKLRWYESSLQISDELKSGLFKQEKRQYDLSCAKIRNCIIIIGLE